MLTLTVFGTALLLAYYLADQLDRQDERSRLQRAKAQGRK